MSAKKTSCKETASFAAGRTTGKNATITITNGCFAGLEIALSKKNTKLGRNIDCDICLDDPHVAAEHAVIHKDKDTFVLEDLDSRRGTMLNGRRIHHEVLHPGDVISIGAFELRFSR